MDPTRFDYLARVLGRPGGRRAVVGALLGALLGPAAVGAARKRSKAKDRDRGDGRAEDRERDEQLQAERRGKGGKRRKHKKKRRGGLDGGQSEPPTPGCCGTESCADPEPGGASAGCDFSGRSFVGQDHNGSTFRGIDGRGANFTATDNRGSVFSEACLQGARFRRAQLGGSTWGGACLFDADFTGADLGGGSAVFAGALFCGAVMPDGSVNDRDCDRESPCCRRDAQPGPACQSAGSCPDEVCQTKSCQNGQCVYATVADGASPNVECSTHCCEGNCCAPGATECNSLGLCCAPNCSGRNCGPDGCGADCGTCPAGVSCDQTSGRCQCGAATCANGCCAADGSCQPGNVSNACGSGGEVCAQCSAQEQCVGGACGPVTCGGRCTQDNDCPDLRNCVCNQAQGTCCSRACAGKVCGPDGCGGQCDNTCPPNTVCGANGTECLCTAQSCPNGCCSNGPGNPGQCLAGNSNQACGRPGQTCRTCIGQEECQNGQCICVPTTCAEQGRTCGTTPDGCGGTLQCGLCGGATPSCNNGVCTSCGAMCSGCSLCFNFIDGNTRCSGGAWNLVCGPSNCSSTADCTDGPNPACVTSWTDPGTNQSMTPATLCPDSGLAAICAYLDPC